jgi:uncharacterized delta-60 repeat protein
MLPVSRSDARLDLTAPSAPAGQLDCRFGVMGRATAEYPHFGGATSESIAYASAMDSTGRLLIAGHSFDARGTLVASIVRFRANGTVDAGFGIHGFVTLPTAMPGGAAWLRHIAVAPDGHILVAFDVKGDERRSVCLCRLLPDGAIDVGFMRQGYGALTFLRGSTFDTVRGLVILPDGGVLLMAATHCTEAGGSVLAIARLHADGSPDTRFGGNESDPAVCRVVTPQGTYRRRPWLLALTPDGGMVVGGDLTEGPDERQIGLVLLRFDASGRQDRHFGDGSGVALLEQSGNDILRQLLVRDDGCLLAIAQAGGRHGVSLTKCTQLTRAGTPDAKFGRGGQVITALGTDAKCQRPQAACLQPDGKLLLVGTPWAARSGQRVTLARLLPNGCHDEHFGEAGFVNCGFHSNFEQADAVSVDNAVGVHSYGNSVVIAGHMLERGMKYKFGAVTLQA